MEKTLRFIAIAAIVGAVAITVSQQQIAARADGTSSKRSAIAADETVQTILRWHFSNVQNAEIEKAEVRHDNTAIALIIKVNCYYNLALMQPAEQQREIHDVMQVDKWVPNDTGWAAVTKAPVMAKALITVDKDTAAKAMAKWNEVSSAFMKPIDDAIRRAASSPGFDKLSKVEQNMRIHEECKKLTEGKTKVEMSAAAANRSAGVVAYTLSLLNKGQRAEAERIIARFERDLSGAVAGRAPSFLNP